MLPDSIVAPRRATVASAVVASLLDCDVDTMFGVAGTHTLALLGAVERHPAMRYITARTEVGAVGMAIGYARASGRASAVLTSTGPGALNALSELADARWGCIPLVHVTTSIEVGRFGAAVHETPYQTEFMTRAGKGSVQVVDDDVASAVYRAVEFAMTYPRGPITLDLTVGTLGREAVTPVARARRAPAVAIAQVSPEGLSSLAADVEASMRPVFYVGGGALVADGGGAVRELATKVGAPIVTSFQGKHIADWSHPGYLGPWSGEPVVQSLFGDADLAVVFGSKLSASGTDQWRLPLNGPAHRVDVAPSTHEHYHKLRLTTADAADVAQRLNPMLSPRAPWALERVAHIRSAVISNARERGEIEMEYMDALTRSVGRPRLITYDMTKAGFWAEKYVAAPPGTVQAVSSYLAMGTALPMAIGMAVASGEPVLAVVGDGGLQMSIAELATLAELRLPVSVLLVVDHAYGLLRDNGRLVDGSENVGVALWNPDFERLGAAYNIEVVTVTTPGELEKALDVGSSGPRMLVLNEEFARQW
jgi:acetolactate synthase I/II/III large subunit